MRTRIQILVLASLFCYGLTIGQNLVVNGDLENWTGGNPTGWTVYENISQESTTVYGGNYSARHTSASTSQRFQQIINGIQGGQEYTISYWYLDNDNAARTRIWSYWTSGGANLADDAAILRPNVYSTNNPNWQQFTAVLTAPATADGFKFEVRVYNQDGNIGGSVFYDNFFFSGQVIIDPEPSNYPTNFTATPDGLNINLSWTDAVGTQLPSSYLIVAGNTPSLPVPVDGVPVANDLDLSDGSGALNVSYGAQTASFPNLESNTTYYFKIYPYTNTGPNIDYKTDGTAPPANATTGNFVVIEAENFDVSWGNWTTISVIGPQEWSRDNNYGINGTPCAQMSGWSGTAAVENEDWLISPAMDFDDYDNESLVFYTAKNYVGPALQCLISENYAGTGNPNLATWINLPFTPSPGNWAWTHSGVLDVSGFNGTVHIAFKYTSTNSESATWEVDDITIVGEEDFVINPEPSNYPTSFTATPGSNFINLSWTDATGTQLPSGYIIFAGTSPSLPVPVDGTPVPNDPDLSDGSGALNVAYGLQSGAFSNLNAGVTYYFSVYPYTNSGANIDYKTDGTAPTANATALILPEPANYPTQFTAVEAGMSISLSWTDAIGAQLPDAYIILAGTSPSLPVPVDGTPIPNDPDLSDGSAAMNIAYGVQQYTFTGLLPSTTYYFAIYPYTNSGSAINYKSDGTAPTANATTSFSPVILYQDFSDGWGDWNTISVTGDQVWHIFNNNGFPNPPSARMNGFSGGAVQNEDWLISPSINMNIYQNVIMTFHTFKNFTGPDLELRISTNYTGSGNPNNATWSNLPFTPSPGSSTWTASGDVELSGFSGSAVYVAFVYNSTSNSAAEWQVDNILIEQGIVLPEPTNYPTSFEANATGTSIHLSWIDAVGGQLPDAYLIVAGTSPTLPVPVDGTPVANDPNLSDGSGAMNIAYGVQQYTFSGLQPSTTYYFRIYPYTNSGSATNYKNDGTAPAANATSANTILVTIEYENFDQSWGNWTRVNVTGAQEWDRNNTFGINNSPCAKISGYEGGTFYVNDDWLISPPLNLDNYQNAKLTFYNAANYNGPNLELKVSENYTGGPNPGSATWTTLPYTMSPGSFTWTHSGEINLAGFSGSAVYVAFHFTSTATQSKTWEVDEILITGEEEYTIQPEPSNYPTNFEAAASGTNISLFWADATGGQLPNAYIILAGTSDELPIPVDGIPIPNDPDLSDGSGAINVNYGAQQASFAGLDPATTYYFAIYPYTNFGSDIDYKNDGTAPTASATTGFSPIIFYQDFSGGWGDWTTISVKGDQVWHIFTSNGYPDPPSARMNGFSGGAVENEDWLISPAINMDNYQNVIMTFHTFKNFSGPNLELRISTNYTGSGNPNNASWTNLSFTPSPGASTWTASGDVELSGFSGSAVYVAFVYNSTSSAAAEWQVDNILIKQDITLPEPSNYPTAFSADVSGTSIILTWNDATGNQIPEAYLIFGGTSPNLPIPVDGVPVSDNTNLGGGSAAVNVPFGQKEFTFTSLPPNTNFYFTIYPYTNSGKAIDYKTDGNPPLTNATTANITLVTIEYENFDESWGNWTTVNVEGAQVWERNNTFGINNSPCAKISGYEGMTFWINDDWLISPPLNLVNFDNVKLSFYNAANYNGPNLELKVSNDYNGGGNPGSANWTSLPYTMSPGSFTWTHSGEIDLSDFTGTSVYVAFHFTSTATQSKTWEVDEILITGEEEYIVKPEPSNYPAQFTATGAGNKVKLTWVDATGEQLPDGYIIFAGTSTELPIPTDGMPIQIDSDLSDGNAAVRVSYGLGEYMFSNGAQDFTTYYFSIYPFTNIGTDVNYKNDGTAPTATASTTAVIPVTIEFEDFNTGWGNWTQVNVEGPQEWTRNNTFGLNNSPCAQISGYSGGSFFINHNWLISPPLNLSLYLNTVLHFYNAKNYNGPDLKVMVSTDYEGDNNPGTANWTELNYIKSSGGFEWTPSGDIDLSGFGGNAVYIGFQFTSTATQSATWELDNIEITGEIEVGIQENRFDASVGIFPNPAVSIFTITQDRDHYNRATIYNISGQALKSSNLTGASTEVNVSDLGSGLYFIRIENQETGATVTRKLIIR